MQRCYVDLVQEHERPLGIWFKMAIDLAQILDHPITKVRRIGQQWIGPIERRIRAFKKLQILFLESGINVPLVPEESFVAAFVMFNHPPHENIRIQITRPLKVAIVDDAPEEILDSALVLVGLSAVNTRFFHYDRYRISGLSIEGRMEQLVDKIISYQPDIILMDHSLGDFEGPAVVQAIKNRLANEQPIFIANTGSRPDLLLEVGCLDNFQKGRNPQALFSALQDL